MIDTNVLLSGLQSKRGASYALLSRMGGHLYHHAVSTAIVLEYEEVLLRNATKLYRSPKEIGIVLDYLVSESIRVPVHYRWRPFLKDPADECVLEAAVAAQANSIVTYNLSDFVGVEQAFGIQPMTPKSFLKKQGVIQ